MYTARSLLSFLVSFVLAGLVLWPAHPAWAQVASSRLAWDGGSGQGGGWQFGPGASLATPPPGVGPPTPLPPVGCTDLLQDGGFENGLTGWYKAPNYIPARQVSAPLYSGTYALQLSAPNAAVYSYSSLRQPVTIPTGYSSVWLEFWAYAWADTAPDSSAHQEAVVLDLDGTVRKKLWRVLSNERAWTSHRFPLDEFAGQSVVLYFNAVNDPAGGRVALYLDEIHVWACPPESTLPSGPVAPATPPAPVGGQVVSGTGGPLPEPGLPSWESAANGASMEPGTVLVSADPARARAGDPKSQSASALPQLPNVWRERWWAIVAGLAVLAALVLLYLFTGQQHRDRP